MICRFLDTRIRPTVCRIIISRRILSLLWIPCYKRHSSLLSADPLVRGGGADERALGKKWSVGGGGGCVDSRVLSEIPFPVVRPYQVYHNHIAGCLPLVECSDIKKRYYRLCFDPFSSGPCFSPLSSPVWLDLTLSGQAQPYLAHPSPTPNRTVSFVNILSQKTSNDTANRKGSIVSHQTSHSNSSICFYTHVPQINTVDPAFMHCQNRYMPLRRQWERELITKPMQARA